jgi:hypothetical protein
MLRRVQCWRSQGRPVSNGSNAPGPLSLHDHAGVGNRFDCVVGGMNSSKAQLPVKLQVTHTVNYGQQCALTCTL